MDEKIRELQDTISEAISFAIHDLQDSLQFERTKKLSQGFSIVGAGIKDIFGDYVNNNYEINDTGQLYLYGFLFFYGLGFGLPLVVSSPSPTKYDCGLSDYHEALERYGLTFDTGDIVSQVQ